jgi:plastocyanin
MNHIRSFLQAVLLAGAWSSANAATLQVDVAEASGKALPEAVVFLESASAKAASKPLQNIEIGQQARQFTPQVNVVTAGTSVTFPNRDNVRHHVYSFSPAKTFELKLYTGTLASPVVFDKPGIAVLGCNIHDNMAAWVVIVETPYYGRSGADGKLTLANVPPGDYRLRVWHTRLPVGAPALDQAVALAATSTNAAVRLSNLAP